MSSSAFRFELASYPLRELPNHRSQMVSELLYGEIIDILDRDGNWLLVRSQHQAYSGWMEWDDPLQKPLTENRFVVKKPFAVRKSGHGIILPIGSLVNENEIIGLHDTTKGDFINPIGQLVSPDFSIAVNVAKSFAMTPYLWGGRSPHGIDCSGLVQVCYSCLGYALPRDAFEQATYGSSVGFSEILGGDLAFFSSSNGKIVHVGICTGNGHIIHSSGYVRSDQLLETGILRLTTHKISHQLAFIKRLD